MLANFRYTVYCSCITDITEYREIHWLELCCDIIFQYSKLSHLHSSHLKKEIITHSSSYKWKFEFIQNKTHSYPLSALSCSGMASSFWWFMLSNVNLNRCYYITDITDSCCQLNDSSYLLYCYTTLWNLEWSPNYHLWT